MKILKRKKFKFTLMSVTILTSALLFTNVSQSKVFAEAPAGDMVKSQSNYLAGVLQPGESYINDGGPQVSSEEERELHTNGPLQPRTRAATITSSYTISQALDWLNSKVGQSIETDGAPPDDPIQCVDLARAYSQQLGFPVTYGNASDYAYYDYSGFTSLPGTMPEPGDIVVWTGGFEGYGHVGVATARAGNTFVDLEQNVNGSKTVQPYSRTTAGFSGLTFWGVLRPSLRIQATVVPTVNNAVYRLYNPGNGDHYYTASQYEAQSIVNSGWQYDGIAFYKSTSGGTPIYVLYNPNSGEHFLTGSSFEANSLAASGWNNQGISWTAPSSGAPVYRLYNPQGFHFWTTSAYEKNSLVAAGWSYEGVAFYG
ncbi:hypothetical protein OfM1_09180 [Lactovum odontotermitis]